MFLINHRRARLNTTRLVFGGVAIGALIAMPCSSNAQTPADDVAAQVRAQGYRCDQPITAKRDVKRSNRTQR
jgi:hypothetical protein